MLGTHFTKIKGLFKKKLAVNDIISIIQTCESSQVHSFELDSLKIHFSPVRKANEVVYPNHTPEVPSQDTQSQPKPSLTQDQMDELLISDPLEWEEKHLG